jgi:hypothetical protein
LLSVVKEYGIKCHFADFCDNTTLTGTMGDELQVSSTTSDAGICNSFSISHLLLQAVKGTYGLKLLRRLTQ